MGSYFSAERFINVFPKIIACLSVNFHIVFWSMLLGTMVDFVGVFQNTSLVFTLGVVDVLGKAKTLGAATGHTPEGYIAATIIYISFSLLLKDSFLLVEKRLIGGRAYVV